MTELIQLGDLRIAVTRKAVKNVHLSVHPPCGRVTLVAPTTTRLDVARAYAISKIGWIRNQQTILQTQARETPRQFIKRETHILWGRRYLLSVVEKEVKPSVTLDHRRITLIVRPGSSLEKRQEVMDDWYRYLLHQSVPALIAKWEARLGVKVSGYYLQKMKTKWGGCNFHAGNIRLNTQLAKKPKDLLEYVLVHEMLHLIEPTHSERFFSLLARHFPTWAEARAGLNELPLAAENWST